MRTVTVLGPSGSGKSALVAGLAGLGQGGPPADLGRGPALTAFAYGGDAWAAIDCPGTIEHLPEARAALLACDAAVICVGPDPEEAVLAAPHLRLVEETGTPVFLFINRMDEAGGRVRDVVAALQDYAAHPLILRQVPIRGAGGVTGAVDLVSERAWQYRARGGSALVEIPESVMEREAEAREALLEDLADLDEWLLEELIEDRQPPTGPLYAICTRALQERAAIPALLGSAARGNGITRLMKALRHEVPGPEALAARLAAAAGGPAPAAVCFHADHRRHVGKVAVLRSFAGGLGQGARLGGAALGSRLDGKGAPQAAPGEAGGIAAFVKSDHLEAGTPYTAEAALPAPAWAAGPAPMLARVLSPAQERDEAKLATALARLAGDEPGLALGKDAATGRPVVHLQGPTHLRGLGERLSDVFGIAVADSVPATRYRETVTRPSEVHHRHRKQSGGAGQFADVTLRVTPTPRGTGFSFSETVKGGAVPRGYFPAVEEGARDALGRGPLGFPVTDVHVTLLDGRHHSVDSSDIAFRTAARQGVAEALAGAVPVLLQPVHRVASTCPRSTAARWCRSSARCTGRSSASSATPAPRAGTCSGRSCRRRPWPSCPMPCALRRRGSAGSRTRSTISRNSTVARPRRSAARRGRRGAEPPVRSGHRAGSCLLRRGGRRGDALHRGAAPAGHAPPPQENGFRA